MELGYFKVLWEYSSKYPTKCLCVKDLGLGLWPNLLCESHNSLICHYVALPSVTWAVGTA